MWMILIWTLICVALCAAMVFIDHMVFAYATCIAIVLPPLIYCGIQIYDSFSQKNDKNQNFYQMIRAYLKANKYKICPLIEFKN